MANLEKYSTEELHQLKKDIDTALAKRRKDDEKRAREEMKEVAQKYGFNLTDLVAAPSANGKAKSKPNAPVKFVHPDDDSKRWSGRGRKPQWVKEWEAAGHSLEDARVA